MNFKIAILPSHYLDEEYPIQWNTNGARRDSINTNYTHKRPNAAMNYDLPEDIIVSLNEEGSREYAKVSYPIRYGRYSQISDREHIYQFNPSGIIKFIRGRGSSLPLSEWLKRTASNDWVYYSTEGYNSVVSLIGEYYLPCFSYSRNSISAVNPFETSAARNAMKSFGNLLLKIERLSDGSLPHEIINFLSLIRINSRSELESRSDVLHQITGGSITVLPPDTRHVDYDVIPIIIADGCLYNCGFCIVKTGQNFSVRSRNSIIEQIEKMRDFYGPDLANYNSIFLGQHDALHAGTEIIEFAAAKAYDVLSVQRSYMKGANLFLFGSVDSLLSSSETLYQSMNTSPFFTYINIGLESADQKSLEILNKPITVKAVKDAFQRIADINRRYDRIEITANFVIGPGLPVSHQESIIDLSQNNIGRTTHKGGIYLSPLNGGEITRELKNNIYHIKNNCRLPVYLYLIQRL
jgi:hypothetical protein